MKLLSSLTNRIFMASAALAVLSIGFAIYIVNVKVSSEAERQLHRGLEEAGTLLEQHRATLVGTFTLLARTIADLPRLKAAVATDDEPTVEPVAVEYQRQVSSDLFIVTNRAGRILAAIGPADSARDRMARQPAIEQAIEGTESSAFWPHPQGVLQVVTVPIAIGRPPTEILGSLSVGFLLDNELARQFKMITDSEIAFADGGTVRASTLDERYRPLLTPLLGSRDVSTVRIGNDDYVALPKPLAATTGKPAGTTPIAIVLRSRTERLRFLGTIHTALALAALVAVLVAVAVSYAVARTVTRPLAAITASMRDMATTGDLTQKIVPGPTGEWDEDARLLAATFNTLTDSIAVFQREAAQRERLSSLGRLSTVVAHEIRNPLMIIKASLRTMRRESATPLEIREAATDIDEEVGRLNRVVTDVLDFARPLRFEYTEIDLNSLCENLVGAMAVTDPASSVIVQVDPTIPPVVTDAAWLRVALVNILSNANEAVGERATLGQSQIQATPTTGRPQPAAAVLDEPEIELRTERLSRRRIAVIVRDRGTGIEPTNLPRVFEPYFTTKRAGTGLGLAIARNIVEGLGGTIGIVNLKPAGTEIRIELPQDSRPASAPRA